MKALFFVGSSQKDIQGFHEDVKDDIGFALFQVQQGALPAGAKFMKGFGAGVLEIIEDFHRETYWAVFTIRFDEVVYVLHCFQKKSKHGIKTPPRDLELIKQRMKMAEEHHRMDHGDKNEP